MVTYEELAQEFHLVMSENTLRLINKEDFSHASELPDIGVAGQENRAKSYLTLADRIEAAEIPQLSIDQSLDLRLATDWLRAEALELTAQIEGTPIYAVKPDAMRMFFEYTALALIRDPRDVTSKVDDLRGRLNMLGNYLKQGLERLDRPAKVWRDLEIESTNGFFAYLKGVLSFAHEQGYQDLNGLKVDLLDAFLKVEDYKAKLSSLETRETISIGTEQTRELFANKGIEVSLEEMASIAVQFVQDRQRGLEELRLQIIRKYGWEEGLTVLEVGEKLKEQFQLPNDQVVEFARSTVEKATQFALEHGLMYPISTQRVEVLEKPPYLEVTVAATWVPESFAVGDRIGSFYINSSHKKAGVILNKLNIPIITCHELQPGHGFQYAAACDNPSPIRKWVDPMDLAEGWTTFVAEDTMHELGYLGNPDLELEERYMGMIDILRLGGRVGFALALLTGDKKYLHNELDVKIKSEDIIGAATEYYMAVTGFAEDRARGDVEHFSTLSTYPALYLVGNTLMRRMVEKAKKGQGESFELPKLLKAILEEGKMPLSYVDRALEQKGVYTPKV